MFNLRVTIVRILVSIATVIAIFGIGWYEYTRFLLLNKEVGFTEETEVNNPRLDHIKMDRINTVFSQRKYYSSNDQILLKFSEADPFYQ